MAEEEDITQINPEYFDLPLIALQTRTRHRISLHLNLDMTLEKERWQYLADRIGVDCLEIKHMEQYSRNPTGDILNKAIQNGYTVGQLLTILHEMNRYDVLHDCQKMIAENAISYKLHQTEDVLQIKDPFTNGELETGKEEYFDAFVSYHIDDQEFIQELSDKLETEEGFKLCIPARDFCIGLVENEATAELIQTRCKRVIIVLSKSYVGMVNLKAKLRWQLMIASALAPTIRDMHMLVPIVIDPLVRIPQDVPKVLIPYNVTEHTKPSIQHWSWKRIIRSLDARTSNSSEYNGPQERLGIKANVPKANNSCPIQANHTDCETTSPQVAASNGLPHTSPQQQHKPAKELKQTGGKRVRSSITDEEEETAV